MNRAVRGDDRPATVKVAAIQCSSDLGDVAANCQKLTALVRQAAARGAKIVVLPEAAITGFVSQDLRWNWHLPGRPLERAFRGRDPAPVAQSVPGPATEDFCALAKELQIYLTIPFVERVDQSPPPRKPTRRASEGLSQPTRRASEDAGPAFFNTVCLAAPDGRLVAHYRKLHPWPPAEQSWATAGDRGLAVFDTEYGRVGLAICFDIHTILADYSAQQLWTLLFPTAWVDEEHPADWFHHKLPREAAKYRHHVIAANWSVDRPERWRGYGYSTIISAEGQVLATARSLYGSEIVLAELALRGDS
jgi:predicted amidohydrolase